MVWIPKESPYERDWDSGVYPDSNPKPLNAPNQQLTISWEKKTEKIVLGENPANQFGRIRSYDKVYI